jgi:hypothetical protein
MGSEKSKGSEVCKGSKKSKRFKELRKLIEIRIPFAFEKYEDNSESDIRFMVVIGQIFFLLVGVPVEKAKPDWTSRSTGMIDSSFF